MQAMAASTTDSARMGARRPSFPVAAGAGAGSGTPVASVTYAAATALMHSALPGHLFTTLTPHLPLHNLHWKPDPPLSYAFGPHAPGNAAGAGAAAATAPGTPTGANASGAPGSAAVGAGTNPIRTIQALPLSFEPFSVAHSRAQQIQQWLYNPTAPQNATSQILDPAYPFVHLYLAICPDSDTYRTTVRNEIRSWLLGIGAFSGALQVSAGSLADDALGPDGAPNIGGASANAGTSSSKAEKHSSLPGTAGEPEFLIVLITPPEGMPDLSALPDDAATASAVASARAGTPPVGGDDSSAGAGTAPTPPPKSGKPARSSTGSTLSSGGTGFFSSMTASKNKGASAVLEKMRADFNANKRERVVHISRLPPLPVRLSAPQGDGTPTTPRTASAQLDPTLFIDLLTRLKECCSNSLSTVLKTRMASIRALLGAIEVLEPGPASPYWRGHGRVGASGDDEGAKLFARYIQSQAFVLRCLEGLGLWEDALEGWNSVADTYMRLVLGGHDPFAPSEAAILSAAISQISLPMPHPALLRTSSSAIINPSIPHLVDPADMLPSLPSNATAALAFRIALYTRRATIQGAYLGKVLHVLQEGAGEVRAIGRTLVRLQEQQRGRHLKTAPEEFSAGADEKATKEGSQNDSESTDLEAEVWTYQAALQLSRTCDSWLAERGRSGTGESSSANASSSSLNLSSTSLAGPAQSAPQQQISPAFHAARAEILEVARRQLDRMGLLVGWLPAQEPWLTGFRTQPAPLATAIAADPSASSSPEESAVPIAIRALFSSREIFDLRYSSLTERVLAACMLASSSGPTTGGPLASATLSAVPSSMLGSGGPASTANGRKRHVLFLRIVLSSLDFIRGRWKEAFTSLVPLAESCAPTISGPVPISSQQAVLRTSAGNGWPAMEAVLRAQCLQCHAALGMPQDRAWVGAVVAWLRASVGARRAGVRTAPPSDQSALPGPEASSSSSSGPAIRVDEPSMFAALRSASASMDKEVAVSGFSPFEVLPADKVATRQPDPESGADSVPATLTTDGHLLKVKIRSALAAAIRVDDVRLCLTNGEREQLWFTSGKVTIQPVAAETGESIHQVLQLFCASYAPGTYAVDVAQVRVAKVIFQIPLLPQPTPSAGADTNTAYASGRLLTSQGARGIPPSAGLFTGMRTGMPFLVNIPEDADSLQAELSLPEVIRLGERRCGIVEIRTGRNTVRNADVTLLLLHEDAGGGSTVLAGLAEAELLSKEGELVLPDSSIGPCTGKVQLKGIPAQSVVRLQFPLLEAASMSSVRLMLSIDYYSTAGSDAPAAEGAEFSPLLRRQYRRVQDLTIALPLGVNAQDFFRRDLMLCKFTISSAAGTHLRVQNPRLGPARYAEDDGGQTSSSAGRLIVQAPPTDGTPESELPFAVGPKQPASFVFRLVPNKAVDSNISASEDPVVFELTLRYQAMGSDGRQARGNEKQSWQTIVIPVEVPSMDLVNEVDFALAAPHSKAAVTRTQALITLVAGKPVCASFTITSSDRWRSTAANVSADGESHNGGGSTRLSEAVLLYDIVPDLDTWLICGTTRGTIRVRTVRGQETTTTLDITLIPLRDGLVPFPQLTLKPLRPETLTCETYMVNAGARVKVELAPRAAVEVGRGPLPLGARGVQVTG